MNIKIKILIKISQWSPETYKKENIPQASGI